MKHKYFYTIAGNDQYVYDSCLVAESFAAASEYIHRRIMPALGDQTIEQLRLVYLAEDLSRHDPLNTSI